MARTRAPAASARATARGAKSTSSAAAGSPPRRQSQRLSTAAAPGSTPKKSIYFEHSSDDGENGADDASSTAYEDDNDGDESATTDPEADDSDDEDGEAESSSTGNATSRKRKRAATQPSTVTARKAAKGKELWREGVKSELQPGEEVFIALPKAREAGKTPYRDETVHPNTLLFLGDLKRNNERQWLKLHDKDFRQSERDWKSFVDQMTEKLVEVDETLPELPAKDIVFRIYRDVRFSNDPTPYKAHFSAAWSRTGRKGPYAAYYLQIAPGSSFVGGGLWFPESQYLAKLRRDFDRRSQRIKAVLADEQICNEFLGSAQTESKALKAFLGKNSESALKRHPKGYDESNPNIGLLRLRSFTMGRKLKDVEVTDPKFLERIVQTMGAMTPFITYLNSVVMPDPGAMEDGSESDDVSES